MHSWRMDLKKQPLQWSVLWWLPYHTQPINLEIISFCIVLNLRVFLVKLESYQVCSFLLFTLFGCVLNRTYIFYQRFSNLHQPLIQQTMSCVVVKELMHFVRQSVLWMLQVCPFFENILLVFTSLAHQDYGLSLSIGLCECSMYCRLETTILSFCRDRNK